ncbi:hypothetical protein WA171_001451, partial [Blastocystis sp. BT1]
MRACSFFLKKLYKSGTLILENEKKLRIAVGKCTRLSKEIESYLKEEKSETEQIEQMRESKADEYDIKQLENVLAQTKQMIPRVKKDYDQSLEELDDLLAVLESDESIQSNTMFAKAKELVNEKKL